MKLRHLALLGGIFTVIISLLLFLFIVTSDDEESGGSSGFDYSGMNLSAEVLKHQPTVEKYAKQYGISDYVNYLLAIMQVESGGVKVTYKNEISIKENGGWRYKYGNMFYVRLVAQYLAVPNFSNATVQAIFNEALKYQGWTYVFGGDNPNTSFDCSGLVQWCYGKAGISLPRVAQDQYDATQHIPLSQAKAGDLVFFHSTYPAGTYVTHVGIYAENNRMYNAGNPIGYTFILGSDLEKYLIGAGRIRQ